MEYRELGRTGQKVSALTLGTMTFGEQNTEAEGHEQMDYALDQGINLFDAAEIYPIPPKAATQGATEEIVGTWLASRKARDKVLIATKVAGRSSVINWLRDEPTLSRQTPEQMRDALHKSLKRLQTDYVDLYQLHWPDRPIRVFEGLEFQRFGDDAHNIHEILGVLRELVASGKVRFVGLSNETPWGVMQFLKLSAQH
ncbi:MAG: aldo/keto reductase, partial [Pseudomonadota bacterium]